MNNPVNEKPFDNQVWEQARQIANEYKLLLEPDRERGYIGSSLEFPTVLSTGATANECVESTREALAVAVATILEAGRNPPAPACEQRRQVQVNIRLTDDEKLLLQEAARRCGFNGLSDFVRSVALERARAA